MSRRKVRRALERVADPQVLVITQALREFISQAAQLLVLYGPPSYEVDYLLRPDAKDDVPVAFRLEPLPPGSLGRIRRKLVQYVPRDMADHVRRDGLGYVDLDPERLVTLRLPRSLEREVRSAVRFLTAATRQQGAEFALVERSMREPTNYDATAHRQTTGELLLAATRRIGWSARGLHRDRVLDPYNVWRQLQFKRFQVELRDSILRELNAALGSIGRELRFEAQLHLSGVPTLAELDQAQADLIAGRRSLPDLAMFAI